MKSTFTSVLTTLSSLRAAGLLTIALASLAAAEEGYLIWAETMEPLLARLLGEAKS